MSGENERLEVETPLGKAKIPMSENINTIITFLTFVAVVWGISWAYGHRNDAEAAQQKVAAALDKHNDGIDKMIKAQKENTCILSLDQAERKAEFNSPNSLCKRMAQ